MAFGLWVNVAFVLIATPAMASRAQDRSFRQAVLSKDLERVHLSETTFMSNTTMDMVVAKGLSTAAKDALHKILRDLATIGFGVKRGPNESKEEFMPKCLAHVNELVHTLDMSYTDIQLETVLQHECQLSLEFPKTHSS